MSSSSTLGSDAAAVLASLDPALAPLEAALRSAENDSELLLHDVLWAPGEGCQLAFRKRTQTGSDFLAVTVDAGGWSQQNYRDDGALPGIRRATEPAAVTEMLATAVRSPLAGVRIEPVRYRVGARCVLRYDARTDSGTRTVYAKVLAPEAFEQLAHRANALDRLPTWSRLGPRLVGTWPQLGVVLTEGAPGVAATAVLGDASAPLAARARLAHGLGALLAELHGVADADVPPSTPEDHLAAVRGSARAIVRADAALGARLLGVLDRLEAQPPSTTATMLCHGGFRAGQVVVSENGDLAVLDLDGCYLGDGGRDLGTALAHLFWQVARQPDQHAVMHHLEDALLAGYRERAPEGSIVALDWWRALAFLQLAARRYRRLEVSNWRRVPALVDAAARMAESWESQSSAGTGADLLDAPTMSRLIAPLLDRHASEGQPTAIESVKQLAAAEGRRVVVSYSVRAGSGGTATSLVGKAFTDLSRARLLDQHLRLLHDGPFHAADLSVPEPLGILPEQRLVLFRGFHGTPLSALTDIAAATEGARRAAHWLARLHASGVPLPRRMSLDHEAEVTREWSDLIGGLEPGLGDRAEKLAVGWLEAARGCPVDRQVPLHKDFHAGHVLVAETVCVIDFDEARLGDPAFDVVHFTTYLEAVPAAYRWEELRDAFLESYGELAGWRDRGSTRAYSAYTWLKIAKQRAVGTGPFPTVPYATRRRLVESAISEGERCLAR
jgi:aminoglycoside phosphotransferase (APT) family kinase protein